MTPRFVLRRCAPLLSLLLVSATLAVPGSAVAAPSVQAEAAIVASSPTRLAVEVSGTGYATSAPGIYVGISESGGASASDASVYRGTEFVRSSQIAADGSFDVTVELDAEQIATLEKTESYSVYTLKAHGLAVSDPSQNAEVPLAIDFSSLTEPELEPEPAVPSVSVSETEVSSAGSTTVTVTGSGFDPSVATGARPPLAGKAAGAYVVFGKFAEQWRPSQGLPSSARKVSSQKWAVPAESMAIIGGTPGGAVELTADGSFTTELVIDKSAVDAAATAESLVNYGIYTYPGAGAAAPAYETHTPITFIEPEPEPAVPSVEVSQTEVSSQGSTSVTVTGSGFDPSVATGARPPLAGKAAGAYVVFGKFAEQWRPSAGAPGTSRVNSVQKWAVPAQSMSTIGGTASGAVELTADGSFTAELVIDKAALDAKAVAESLVNYGIYTYPGSGAVAAAYETYTPITFTDPEPAGPSLDAEITEQVEDSLKVDVRGSGYLAEAPGVYVAIAPSGGASPTDATAYLGTQWVMHSTFGAGGTFERTVSLGAQDIDELDPEESYSIYTLRAHGLAATDPSQTVEVPLDLDIDELQGTTTPALPGPQLDVDVVKAVKGNLTLSVTGRGFARTSPGVYVGLSESGGADTSDAGAYRGAVFVPQTAMDLAGGFTRTVTLDAAAIATLDVAGSYSVYSLRAHGQPDLTPSQTIEVPVDIDVAALRGGSVTPGPGPGTGPGTGTPPTTGGGSGGGSTDGSSSGGGSTPAAARGSLVWGVKSSFRSYVTGPIAQGSISVADGATSSGGGYRFFQRSTTADEGARGTTSYGGSVRFTGHGGVLDLRLSDPNVRVTSSRTASLSVVADGRRVDLATLDLAAGSARSGAGATTYSAVPARLTPAGAGAFDGFYSAGEALDPITFTVGSNSVAAAGGTRTVATATSSAADDFVPPAEPPADTGASLDMEDGAVIEPGGRITATADGFAPNETGIRVVVYSTPVVLDRAVTADASGAVRWSGFLPGDLEPGEHTLTFQGSVDRGVTFTVEEPEVARCEVVDASMTWGVKESFRSYVSGSIANGDWSTSGDASYETPEFTFAEGEGDMDSAAADGTIAFGGAIDFTGHSGALAVTMANPEVRMVDETTAVLLLDVTAGDRAAAQAGDTTATTSTGVPFVELDLAAGQREVSDDGLSTTYTDVPTALTEQGHGVFADYATGESFDPLDLVVATADDCAAAVDEVAAADVGGPAGADVASASSGISMPMWSWAAIAALLALAAAGGLVVGRRTAGSRS